MFSSQSRIKMASSNGNIFSVTGPLYGNSPVTGEFPHKGQWREALMCCVICAWINGWLNNRGWWFETPSRHYDVIVMWPKFIMISPSQDKSRPGMSVSRKSNLYFFDLYQSTGWINFRFGAVKDCSGWTCLSAWHLKKIFTFTSSAFKVMAIYQQHWILFS